MDKNTVLTGNKLIAEFMGGKNTDRGYFIPYWCIVNMDTKVESNYKPNISKQQQISKELIQQTADLKKDLKGTDQKILLELINELETILMQIANLEKEYDYDAVELIRSSLDRKGILVKINLGQILSESNKGNLNQSTKSKNQI